MSKVINYIVNGLFVTAIAFAFYMDNFTKKEILIVILLYALISIGVITIDYLRVKKAIDKTQFGDR